MRKNNPHLNKLFFVLTASIFSLTLLGPVLADVPGAFDYPQCEYGQQPGKDFCVEYTAAELRDRDKYFADQKAQADKIEIEKEVYVAGMIIVVLFSATALILIKSKI